jgi:K+-sensing histidine kinase KdpD
MNFVKADTVEHLTLPAQNWSYAQLVDELDNGLHAMAQPLTVLRGVVGSLKMRGAVASEHSRYLDMSDEQIQRLCHLMSGLRSLLDVAQSQASPEMVELGDLLDELIEEQDVSFEHLRVRIASAKPEAPVKIMGDPERTKHALRAALTTAVRLASHEDVVDLEIVPGDEFVEFRIQNGSAHGKGINSANRLNLAIAQANTLSQRGTFECASNPLSISIKLPQYAWTNPGHANVNPQPC